MAGAEGKRGKGDEVREETEALSWAHSLVGHFRDPELYSERNGGI